ncbi:DUF1127 domain-containing protein [Acidocella facilis]|uniref:DUF1127 domain-containing protein n=1 Tax=Acidocella facilis TaxID=525 RepID=UPI00047B15BB|nr:DUF1127 domain-containing protein [Acidocella facilis]
MKTKLSIAERVKAAASPHPVTRPNGLWARIMRMRNVIVGRRAIMRMDARMLGDIGLSHAEALEEVNRKPWDDTPRPR